MEIQFGSGRADGNHHGSQFNASLHKFATQKMLKEDGKGFATQTI
jgi:hypothetical protein